MSFFGFAKNGGRFPRVFGGLRRRRNWLGTVYVKYLHMIDKYDRHIYNEVECPVRDIEAG